jgi:hypothetical protein
VEIADAIGQAGANPGDWISLAVTGRKQVEVEKAYHDDMGHRHTRRITTHRNVWTASVADAPSQGLSLKELPDKITEYIGHNTSKER